MRSRIATIGLLAAAPLGAPLLGPAMAHAQGASMEYTEVTRVEAPGVVGALLRGATGGEETHGIHVLDGRVRADDGSTSTILDAAEREWILLDHDPRTYLRFSFADIQQITTEMMDALDEGRAEPDAEMETAQAEMEEARQTIEVSIEHVPTGETDRIDGYAAERHHIIVVMEEAEGIDGADEVEDGSLAVVVDLWLSEELARANPVYGAIESDPAFRELGQELAASLESAQSGDDLAAYAMLDPRVGAAMAEAFESLAEMEGMAVRTTTTVAVLPPAVELDTELLISWEPESMGAQIRGEASAAAQEAARDAARGAVRSLTRGVLGRDGDREPEVAEEDLIIRPLFRVTTEVVDVHAGGAPAPDLFTIPEGYEEMAPPSAPGNETT